MEGLTSLSESVPDPLWESSLTEEERIRRVRIQAILDDVAKTEPTAARVAVYYYDPDVRRTYKDTAVHFGISEYVVGRHLRRVRQFLRACYSDDRRFLFGPHHSRKNGRRRRK